MGKIIIWWKRGRQEEECKDVKRNGLAEIERLREKGYIKVATTLYSHCSKAWNFEIIH